MFETQPKQVPQPVLSTRGWGWIHHRLCLTALAITLTLGTAVDGAGPSTQTRREDMTDSKTTMQETTPLWQHAELRFKADRGRVTHTNVEFSAGFTGPDGTKLVMPGFWDGGDQWLIRFTPTSQGRWQWQTHCPELADLDGLRGAITAGPPEGDSPLYRRGGFLKVSENRRHLTYTDGTPFFWLGDTLWSAPTESHGPDPLPGEDTSMFHTVLAKRKEQGFTVFQMGFLGKINELGIDWLNPESWTDEHMAAWRRADIAFQAAADSGIVCVFTCRWHHQFHQTPLERLVQLWRYIVARYAAFPIVFMVSGEYNAFVMSPSTVHKVRALGPRIASLDPYKRALSAHSWAYPFDRREIWDDPWCDFIMLQGGHSEPLTPFAYLEPYLRHNRKPVLESELLYEGIRDVVTPDDTRRGAYTAIFNGSFGFTYGSHGLWNASPTSEDGKWGKGVHWRDALNRPGGDHMAIMKQLLESVEWWTLEPRPQAVEPLGGKQVHTLARDMSFFVVYIEAGVDPTRKLKLWTEDRINGSQAEWFNPRTGERTAVPGRLKIWWMYHLLPDRPDDNDWVLIVRT